MSQVTTTNFPIKFSLTWTRHITRKPLYYFSQLVLITKRPRAINTLCVRCDTCLQTG